MPIRDLTILLQIIDKASRVLDPILTKMDAVDGTEIEIGVNMDPGQAAAQASAFESSLESLQSASDRVSKTLEKAAEAEQKEGKEAEAAGKKTKESGQAADQASGHFHKLQQYVDGASQKFSNLKDHLDGVKTRLLAIQGAILGIAAISVYSSAKTETLVEELRGLKGEAYATPLLEWAEQSKGLAWSSKKQRLAIAADLSELGYNPTEVSNYGQEIEKYFFTKAAMLKRQGVGSAEDLAKDIASAEKTGNVRAIERLFSAGAISDQKLSREVDRLRANYEKFAFATDEVVKKQALHNLVMKELIKTNQSFTGQATTLEQKLDVLQSKWGSLLSSIGDSLRPAVTKVVDGLILVIDTIESVPHHDKILIFLGLLVAVITTLISWIFILAPALEALSWVLGLSGAAGAATAFGGAIGTLIGLLGGAATALGGVAVAGAAAITPLLPIIIVLAAIAAIIYLLYTRTTLLQDGFALLQEFAGRASAAILKLWSTVSGGLRGNKADLQEIGTWIRNFLEGLIPGWLSDLFAQAQSIYREAMRWFDRIMGWWNDFLKKVTEVYDKIKDTLGLGGDQGSQITPEMQQYGVTGWGEINGKKAVKVAYRELPSSQWSTSIYDQIRAATGGKTRLTGQEWIDFAQKHPELAKAMTGSGEVLIPMDQLDDFHIPESALPPEPEKPLALPDVKEAASDAVDEGKAAVQESGQTYVEKSSQTYKETLEMTGSETIAAHAAYDPLGFYSDLGGKGVNYLKEKGSDAVDYGKDLIGWGEKEEEKPEAAIGATIVEEGQLKVHKKEEVIPAKIVEGTGKLGSLLAAALNFMNGRADIEQAISEKVFSQNAINNREISAGTGPITIHMTVQAPVTIQVTKEVDLRNLDVTKLIDWSRAQYELEKIVRNTFRFQEG